MTCIPGGVIPYDGVPMEQEVAVAIPIIVIFSILAAVGIVFSVVCLAFNFIFRRKKWAIKLCAQCNWRCTLSLVFVLDQGQPKWLYGRVCHIVNTGYTVVALTTQWLPQVEEIVVMRDSFWYWRHGLTHTKQWIRICFEVHCLNLTVWWVKWGLHMKHYSYYIL